MDTTENKSKTRILLVEDHPIFREGLRMTIAFSKVDLSVEAEADNVRQAVDYIEQHPFGFDIVLLDYFLPDGTGRDVLRVIKEHNPHAKVVLISGEMEAPEVVEMANEGINGLVSKDVHPSELPLIIASVMRGHNYFGKYQTSTFSNLHPETMPNRIALTPRESEILRLSAQGMSARQIAEELHLSNRTVERHKDNLFNKLGCKTTVELVKYAYANGLI